MVIISIIGDLNSYDKEDPIDAIRKGPDDILGTYDDYTDMIYTMIGEDAYRMSLMGRSDIWIMPWRMPVQ